RNDRIRHRSVRRHDRRPPGRPLRKDAGGCGLRGGPPGGGPAAAVGDRAPPGAERVEPGRGCRWLERSRRLSRRAVRKLGGPAALGGPAPGGAVPCAGPAAGAGRLACRRGSLGVTIDGGAGLCAERSPAMVVGVLGILKAGGAYVPLDPAYPRERLAFMVDDA